MDPDAHRRRRPPPPGASPRRTARPTPGEVVRPAPARRSSGRPRSATRRRPRPRPRPTRIACPGRSPAPSVPAAIGGGAPRPARVAARGLGAARRRRAPARARRPGLGTRLGGGESRPRPAPAARSRSRPPSPRSRWPRSSSGSWPSGRAASCRSSTTSGSSSARSRSSSRSPPGWPPGRPPDHARAGPSGHSTAPPCRLPWARCAGPTVDGRPAQRASAQTTRPPAHLVREETCPSSSVATACSPSIVVVVVGSRSSSATGSPAAPADLQVGDCFDARRSTADRRGRPAPSVHRGAHGRGLRGRHEPGRSDAAYPDEPACDRTSPGPVRRAVPDVRRDRDGRVRARHRLLLPDGGRLGEGRPDDHLLRRAPTTAVTTSMKGSQEAPTPPGRRRPVSPAAASSSTIAPGVSCSWSSRPKRAGRSAAGTTLEPALEERLALRVDEDVRPPQRMLDELERLRGAVRGHEPDVAQVGEHVVVGHALGVAQERRVGRRRRRACARASAMATVRSAASRAAAGSAAIGRPARPYSSTSRSASVVGRRGEPAAELGQALADQALGRVDGQDARLEPARARRRGRPPSRRARGGGPGTSRGRSCRPGA